MIKYLRIKISDGNSWRRRSDQQQETILYQPEYIHIPVYDERDVCEVLVDENVITTAIGQEQEQPRCKDFSMNANTKLSENQFGNWPYYAEWNLYTRLIDTAYTILAITFVWLITNVADGISNKQPSKFENLILIISLYLTSAVGGQISSTVIHIPPFVGMILVGMAFQSSKKKIRIDEFRHFFWLYFSEFTESVILIICALELDVWKLRRIRFIVLKLVFLPQIIALSAIILNHNFLIKNKFKLAHLFLFNMLSINSILFMPSMSVLKRLGYFDENNVYTLLHATSNIVNVSAVIINYFACTEYQLENFPNISKKILIDIVFGILWGIFMIHASPPDCLMVNNEQNYDETNDHEVNNKYIFNLLKTTKRVALLFAGGILTPVINLFYETAWYFSLSCGISSLVAGIGWKWKMKETNQNTSTMILNNDNSEDQNQIRDVLKVFKYIWNALQPLFFGFIGTGFQIQYVDVNMVLIIIPVILVLNFIRIIITTCSVWGSGFNCYEIIFIIFSWIPNSSLMAVHAPLYLQRRTGKEKTDFDSRLFNVTIICYLTTTTLWAFVVRRYGPKLLSDNINDHVNA